MRPKSDTKYVQSEHGEVAIARAVFSNDSDWPDELPFDKGDTLRVIDQRPGVEHVDPDNTGWWLCVDQFGNRGYAPANRLEIMHRFDRKFFQVANPLFDDFFMFNGPDRRDPFAEPFFDRPGRLFPAETQAAILSDERDELPPIRRLASLNDAVGGVVVRNIPIRVEQTNGNQRIVNFDQRRERSEPPPETTSTIRRTMSSGRISPPIPPTRKYFNIAPPQGPTLSIPPPTGFLHNSSSDEEEQRRLSEPNPLREDYSRSPGDLNTVDRITQRIKNLANPYRSSIESPLIENKEERSPSPSSSGIGADLTDSNHSDEMKRSSDVSSLSASSLDPNTSLSDHATDDSGTGPTLQPPVPTRSTFSQNGSISRPGGQTTKQPAAVLATDSAPSSTSVLQTVFDNIEKPRINPTAVREIPIQRHFSDSKNRITDWKLPIRVEEDMELNKSPLWNQIPTQIQEPIPQPTRIERMDPNEEEIQNRKRAVVNRMSECLKSIEIAVANLHKGTAPQFWRQPHVLQSHLNSIRDGCVTVHEALESFVDSTGRISIDRSHPKSEELRTLITPLRETRTVVGALRRQLDHAGWTLAVLARDKEQPRTGMDSLEKFIHLAKEIPSACRNLLQWTQLLVPSSSVVFLSASSSQPSSSGYSINNYLLPNDDYLKRLSTGSSSTVTSGDSSTPSQPSSILVTKPSEKGTQRARVTFADETDEPRPLATTSDMASMTNHKLNPSTNGYSRNNYKNNGHSLDGIDSIDGNVMEEDDLESVVSDRDSLYNDYALLDDVVPDRVPAPMNRAAARLGDDDRQLVRFYAPQLDQHTEALSTAIEEFLTVVEQHRPPRDFVQKGKLIILSAHKLIYIGDSVSQCVRDQTVSMDVRRAADRLCNLLKECVAHTKMAADEYPDVICMQTMVDSIVAVSKSAHELKLLVQECC